MDKHLQHPIKPWYRQFWPWFLMALPGAAVIGGITTVIVATIDRDGLVKDDYYKEGLAINRDLARANIEAVRPGMRVFETSAKTGAGIDEWLDYLAARREAYRRATTA